MSKKIKIKEVQLKSILNILAENSNINSVLQSLTPNKSIKIIDADGKELELDIIKQNNDEFEAVDESNTKFIFNKNSYNETTKELDVKIFNTTTNQFFDKKYIVKDILVIDDKDTEDENDGSDLFNKYYKDIINNPNLKKTFYTAPTLWNYIMAKAKGKKASGTGIYPAYKIINSYYHKAIDAKLPGFTDKENLSALFIVPYRIEIRYKYNNNNTGLLVLEAGTNKAVVRPYEPGFGDNKVLIRRNYGFKVVVKKPTNKKDDQYYCDIYVEKTGVKPDTYKVENVKLTFLKSKGYEPQIKNN